MGLLLKHGTERNTERNGTRNVPYSVVIERNGTRNVPYSVVLERNGTRNVPYSVEWNGMFRITHGTTKIRNDEL